MQKIGRVVLPIAVLCVITAVGVVFWRITFKSHGANEPNRKALMRIHEQARIGMAEEEFRTLFEANKTDELTLARFDDLYDISMPFEVGAKDWRLLASIDNGTIRELRIRTTDGPKPEGSPEDKK
jgi:hypothetical protein